VNPALLDNLGHFGRLSGIARLEFPLVAPDIRRSQMGGRKFL
jgi:hypothetical protein